ncbi:hypothetical protein [Nocardioides sp. CER19]|uniref:hypothetical protein n=1 Tax=Nocardioides sp. CER19 TaxID=3038538 RepID=UPI00244D3277|nr:hypothetical protein [Nocardioides sp. CER19]MDH2416873.1 hypothetical protein [Nocardioides sp. CER19]
MRIRIIAALAVLVSAFVHLRLWADGVKHEHMVGPAFMVNAVAGVVIAVLLLAWRHSWVPLFLALGFGASTMGAFIISATAGLYGVHEHWQGGYVWAAFIAEAVAIVTGAVGLLTEGYVTTDRRTPAPHSRAL